MACRVATAVAVLVLWSAPAFPQWLNHPTQGLPRLPDGRPDMDAPARTTADGRPDLSGVWRWNPGRYGSDVTFDLQPGEVAAGARALMRERRENLFTDDPANMKCLPQGPRASLAPFHLAKILQMPDLIVVLYENMSFRQVFMDGRRLPPDPNPSWMGYSVGRWEGDTLVVETIGLTDRSWLDFAGHPHTEALRVTERFRRRAIGRLDVETTFDDRQLYSRPWTIATHANLVADTDLLEYVCETENKGATLIGRASDGIDPQAVFTMPAELLSRYAGTYEYRVPENPAALRTVDVIVRDGQLVVEGNRPLVPLSDTLFALARGQGTQIEFLAGADGAVDGMRIRRNAGCGGSSGFAVSLVCGETAGELRATRRRGAR